MARHGKELSEDLRIRIVALHKDGRGYKKSGNSLELSYSTVSQGHTEVFQDRFHSKVSYSIIQPRKGAKTATSIITTSCHSFQFIAISRRSIDQ